jgi:hypothetical protein
MRCLPPVALDPQSDRSSCLPQQSFADNIAKARATRAAGTVVGKRRPTTFKQPTRRSRNVALDGNPQ